MNKITALGMMSGTSLDGLDLAIVEFEQQASKWKFNMQEATTIAYSPELKQQLDTAQQWNAEEFLKLHDRYGRFLGEEARKFIASSTNKVDVIASHGHTIFHQPENHFTFQIGNAAHIAAITGITTVADFRTLDVALGGQGAPLVPIGDRLLFAEYGICLNLGGFANLSVEENGQRMAYDISAFNYVLNYLSKQKGFDFDRDGNMGREGHADQNLVTLLDKLPFYKQTPPKSLAREWVEKKIYPLLKRFPLSVEDLLSSYYEHISSQIAKEIDALNKSSVLITGGGAYNSYFIDLLKAKSKTTVYIPGKQVIDFKEAIIFAFLGVLRLSEQINTLKSATGATKDSIGGAVFFQ
jgi:anhydro-N-acetylmuramic acid kinase